MNCQIKLLETNPNMSEHYWEDLYQKGELQWEKGEPSPGLVDFLTERSSLAKGSVLVPGCGTGHDARAWARAGFEVIGLDIAPSAVELSKQRSESAPRVEFRRGDFLNDPPFQPFDYVFEHTLFCAIQPSQRAAYVEALQSWLKPDGAYVAVFYLIPDNEGPPFGSTKEEIRRLFGANFELLEDWVPRSYPNRAGLEWMTVWRPRQK
jgi:SAM-dependent methyltransferase